MTLTGGSLNLEGATAGSNVFTNSLIVVISSTINVENYPGSMAAAIVAGSTLSVTSGETRDCRWAPSSWRATPTSRRPAASR